MKRTIKETSDQQDLIPAEQVPWPRPDCADLNDWLFEQENAAFESTRYLSPSIIYDLALSLWHRAGRPTDGFESALWTKEEALG